MNNILIIEDDRDIQELLRYHLEKHGYQPESIDNGADALARLLPRHPATARGLAAFASASGASQRALRMRFSYASHTLRPRCLCLRTPPHAATQPHNHAPHSGAQRRNYRLRARHKKLTSRN